MRPARRRHYIDRRLFLLARPAFRFSARRDAYVLRLVGRRVGPVLRVDRRRRQLPLAIVDRRRPAPST